MGNFSDNLKFSHQICFALIADFAENLAPAPAFETTEKVGKNCGAGARNLHFQTQTSTCFYC